MILGKQLLALSLGQPRARQKGEGLPVGSSVMYLTRRWTPAGSPDLCP